MSEASSHEPCAPLARLGRLAHLDPAAVAAVAEACSTPRHVGANRYVSSEVSRRPLLVVSGWCARVRQVMTQRRVFIDLVLPGELVGPVDSATCALMALTDAAVTTAPSVTASPALGRAYARSLQLRESYIMAHISRLAALDAYQRIHDFIAEVFERQLMVSEPLGGAIDFPLSQKQLGDHLGLTSVHVNRTVNRIRSTKELSWAGKRLSIPPGSGIERYARENIARLRSFEDDVNRRAFVQ